MTTSEKEGSGFPVWLLAVGAGGLVGIVAGALIFFGDGGKPKATEDRVAVTTGAQGSPKESISSGGRRASLASMPQTPEEWDRQIEEADASVFAGLMDGALAIQDPAQRQATTQKLLTKWLNTNIASFLDYMDELEGSESGGGQAWPVLVPAFVASLQNLSDQAAEDPDLEEAVLWMSEYYGEQDPRAALAWAKETLLDDVQQDALATIAGQLSVTSLSEAEALARELTSPTARLDALANIAAVLGEKEPARALQWAQNLADPGERSTALEEALWSISGVDPELAAQELAKVNDPLLIESVGSAIAEELAAKDPAKAVQWASGLPAGPARSEAMAGALAGWAAQDPQAAYAYLQANDRGNGDAMEWVFEEWGAKAPQDAANVISGITDAAARERAVLGLVNGWLSEEDTQGVEQWVDQLPAGRERDMASLAIVDALSFDEPQPAWDRALTISDPQVRQEAILSAFSGLVDSDPQQARAALSAPGLTDEDRQILEPMIDEEG
jgi:hypothetical protein